MIWNGFLGVFTAFLGFVYRIYKISPICVAKKFLKFSCQPKFDPVLFVNGFFKLFIQFTDGFLIHVICLLVWVFSQFSFSAYVYSLLSTAKWLRKSSSFQGLHPWTSWIKSLSSRLTKIGKKLFWDLDKKTNQTRRRSSWKKSVEKITLKKTCPFLLRTSWKSRLKNHPFVAPSPAW